jgi:sugar transferase (PEP-CTERM system associated)
MASGLRPAIDLTSGKIGSPLRLGKVRIPGLRHHVSVSMLLLLVCEIVLLAASYVLSASHSLGGEIRPVVLGPEPLLFCLIMLASISTQGLYRVHHRQSYVGVLGRMIMSYAIGLGLIAFLSYLFPLGTLSVENGIVLLSLIISFLPILLIHTLFFEIVDQSAFKKNVLVLGAGKRASSLSQLRRKSDLRTSRITGYVKCKCDNAHVAADRIINIDSEVLAPYAVDNDIDEILVAADDRRYGWPTEALLACKMHGINIVDLPSFFERETGKINVDTIHPSSLIFSDGFGQNGRRRLTGRIWNTAVSLLLLLLLAPVMILVSLAIIATSDRGESVFYRQKRVGLGNRVFQVIKFRSMISNAEKNGLAQWAREDDERITPVGKFIRKYRLDELPQLLNVLKGDMCLVGPRPERPEFIETLRETIPYYDERHRVRPGITGWAQLNYPYGASEQDAREKLQYDLYYVKNNNLLFDIAILLQTAEIILFKKGSR